MNNDCNKDILFYLDINENQTDASNRTRTPEIVTSPNVSPIPSETAQGDDDLQEPFIAYLYQGLIRQYHF